nr:membrane protein insertase YidC [bacterium]
MWAGLESRYFIGAIIPRVQGQGLSVEYGAEGLSGEASGARELFAGAALPSVTAPSGDAVRSLFSAYAGPKEIGQLKGAGVKLEEAIDYGWFTVIAIPILYCLKFFYTLIHNYGVAIILLTIFVKLLLHPINVKSLKSMKAMQQLQPRLKELQAKYKDDKQKLNQETMQLFRAHKVNPMGGCLPMLAQFPIYIA